MPARGAMLPAKTHFWMGRNLHECGGMLAPDICLADPLESPCLEVPSHGLRPHPRDVQGDGVNQVALAPPPLLPACVWCWRPPRAAARVSKVRGK